MRRYKPIGTNTIYDQYYDTYHSRSQCLNTVSGKFISGFNLSEETGLNGYKITLVGTKKGEYFNPDAHEWRIADIPYVKKAIENLEREFIFYKSQRISEGYKEPDVMPDKMQDEKYRLEAQLDIYEAELVWVQKRLDDFAKAKQASRSKRILTYGCPGSTCGNLQNGGEIDGQGCSLVDGILVINEPLSPFHGIAVYEYREQICKPWREAKQKAVKYNENIVDEARKTGKAIDRSQFVSIRPPIPTLPEGIKKYFEVSNETLKRAKKRLS